jgi:hypothetical protein
MKVLTIISAFLIISSLYSQEEKERSIYLEAGGSGGLGSINYEASILDGLSSEKVNYTWRAGLSFAPIDKNNGTGIVFPIMVNSLIGASNHRLELGVGQGVTITTRGSFFILATALIGYRFAAKNNLLFFRATYTPLISYLIDFQFQQWGGVSIGYTFKSKGK